MCDKDDFIYWKEKAHDNTTTAALVDGVSPLCLPLQLRGVLLHYLLFADVNKVGLRLQMLPAKLLMRVSIKPN